MVARTLEAGIEVGAKTGKKEVIKVVFVELVLGKLVTVELVIVELVADGSSLVLLKEEGGPERAAEFTMARKSTN
ncbi:hypothetical protein BASA61_009848 [Batrachochytrium salamandrivorans]|nr:hypothetical protein BASA61_009848 [Batrachochytrium salamandrivorans]